MMAVTIVKKCLGSAILVQFVEHRDKNNIPCCFLINSTNRFFRYFFFIILVPVCKPCFLRTITRPYSFLLLLSLHLSTLCGRAEAVCTPLAGPVVLPPFCCFSFDIYTGAQPSYS